MTGLTLVAVLVGALATALVALGRALRALRDALDGFEAETGALVAELRASAREAAGQVERVDRLVTAAEGIEERVGSASRLAKRTFRNPVVKAVALGAGVSQASRRLRDGPEVGRSRRRRAS